MIQKHVYEAPEAEYIEVSFEKGFLDSEHSSSFTDDKAYIVDPTTSGPGWTWENN